MTDIQSFTDDEFVAEAQRRVNQGHWSPDRFMSQSQSDDRAKLDILRSAIIVANVASIHAGECHPVLQQLASKCDELDAVYGNPLPKPAAAVNTTLPGKEETFENHQKEMLVNKPPYSCSTCGSSDKNRWRGCFHPGCPDGRDQ